MRAYVCALKFYGKFTNDDKSESEDYNGGRRQRGSSSNTWRGRYDQNDDRLEGKLHGEDDIMSSDTDNEEIMNKINADIMHVKPGSGNVVE